MADGAAPGVAVQHPRGPGPRTLIVAIAQGVVLGMGAVALLGVAGVQYHQWVFFLAAVGFTYTSYTAGALHDQLATGLYWLAIEAFLAPFAIVGHAFVHTTVGPGLFASAADPAGAFGFIQAWFVFWALGVVCYRHAGRVRS